MTAVISFYRLIPVVGDLVPADFIKKIGASSWEKIEKLVREGEADKVVTWDLARAQGMAIGRIDNADAEVDLKNPDAAKKTVSNLIKFADGRDGRDGSNGMNGKDGKNVDMSSMVGYSFLAAILGGGLIVSVLGAMDYLYLLGYLPKEGIPWRADR